MANSPMTWLNFCLLPYVSKLGIIPDTQVATQQGVQTRDLMSYLAGVETWANRHKQPVWCIKRDQMKGFDYLSPQGFHDAIRAYGLPYDIIKLDTAAQSRVSCTIRTAYGMTTPIVIDGVTKQGGPLSPLKSTMTTSLGHRWLDDLASESEHTLVLRTESATQNNPHLDSDLKHLTVTMVEATDDSFIFAKTLTGLQYFCVSMERFQFAYGWLTQWLKTVVYALQPRGEVPEKVTMPSITNKPGKDPWSITYHPVPVLVNQMEMLRTRVNNSVQRFQELRDFINDFTIPKFSLRLPITLLRKIAMQNLASRARALLSLQPITHLEAEHLDHQIAAKVHDLLGFPF